jgi:hypothetical protein
MRDDQERADAVRTAARGTPNRVAALRPTVYCPAARVDACVKERALTGASTERPR